MNRFFQSLRQSRKLVRISVFSFATFGLCPLSMRNESFILPDFYFLSLSMPFSSDRCAVLALGWWEYVRSKLGFWCRGEGESRYGEEGGEKRTERIEYGLKL